MEVTPEVIVLEQVAALPKTIWRARIGDDTFAQVVLHAAKPEEALDHQGRPGVKMVMQADARPFEVFAVDAGGRRAPTGVRHFDRPAALAELVAIGRQMHRKGRFVSVLGALP